MYGNEKPTNFINTYVILKSLKVKFQMATYVKMSNSVTTETMGVDFRSNYAQ